MQVKGDLLNSDAQVIVQQCNCITMHALGLSLAIKKKFGICPYSTRQGQGNVANQETSSEPGTIALMPMDNDRFCACLFAQYAPGSCSKSYASYERVKRERGIQETAEIREQWFAQCLELLTVQMTMLNLTSVAFPKGIGCGLAGGNWQRYSAMIQAFSSANSFSVQIIEF